MDGLSLISFWIKTLLLWINNNDGVIALIISTVATIVASKTIHEMKKQRVAASRPRLFPVDKNYKFTWENNQLWNNFTNSSSPEDQLHIINTTNNAAYNVTLAIDMTPSENFIEQLIKLEPEIDFSDLKLSNAYINSQPWNKWTFISPMAWNDKSQNTSIFGLTHCFTIYGTWLKYKSKSGLNMGYQDKSIELAKLDLRYEDTIGTPYSTRFSVIIVPLGGDHEDGSLPGNIPNDGGIVKFVELMSDASRNLVSYNRNEIN